MAGGTGQFIVIAGPDGTGKTTVADHLASRLDSLGPLLHLHHRPRALGGLTTHDGPVTEPHAQSPYPAPVSVLKVLYLFADHLIGWFTRMRGVVRSGGTVLMERGWWDVAVDPLRYRLRPHPFLVRALGRLLPRPSTTLLLVGDPDVLATRTDELDRAELARQVHAWIALPPALLRTAVIDTAQPLDAVLAACVEAVGGDGIGLDGRSWTALPTAQRARWVLPTRPARATTNGLRVYTPVTPRAIGGWLVARSAARAGMARLLPSCSPPTEVIEQVADLLPPGGTVAIARSTHVGRKTVMLLDHRGKAHGVAKLATDELGWASLAREKEALERMRSRLPEGLNAPALLDARAGRIVYAPIPWRPRMRPWELPVDVAFLLGRLYLSGHGGQGSAPAPPTGTAHGDCGPWNLLRSPDGWYLIDWSDATDDAAPFTDLWHYVIQGHSLLGRPKTRQIMAGLEGRGWIGAAIAAYARGAEVPIADARAQLLPYLEHTAGAGAPDNPEGRRGAAARLRLLEVLAREVA